MGQGVRVRGNIGQKETDQASFATAGGRGIVASSADQRSRGTGAELGQCDQFSDPADLCVAVDFIDRLLHPRDAGCIGVGQSGRIAARKGSGRSGNAPVGIRVCKGSGAGEKGQDRVHGAILTAVLYDSERAPYTAAVMNSEISSETSEEYCAAQVRQYDYERYFAAAFAPPAVRRALFALYAFNLEIASTRERVSEQILGEMRLQWWRDTLEGLFEGTVRKHAVIEELAFAIDRHSLPRTVLDGMIDARSFDLGEDPPEDMAALDRYAAATAGALAGLAVRVCGPESDAVVKAGEAAGTAWGLAGVLRAASFHASTGRVMVPRNALRAAQITSDSFRRAEDREAVRTAVGPVVELVASRLSALKEHLHAVPKSARPAIAYLPVAGIYLGRLTRAGHDVFAPGLEPSRFSGQWRMVRTALTGRL